ncbi:hypothetical protein KEM54_002557 [Ascosphaera aggregata]|nr:hypothetical protein KEM54_002557 [Ascosphaera aggregata]
MAAMREEEVRQGRPMPVKFNQTWRKVEVGDEVGSRQIVGVTKTEHDHGGLITTQQQQPMDVTATAASPVVPAVQVNLSTTSPGAAPVTLSPLHGLGNVAGLSPFPENATRPLGSNTARESRFFPHGGNVSVQERRVSQSSQFSPPIPVVPLSLPTALPMTPSPLPASHEPLPLVLGERSSSPPPPEEYSSAHPVYSFESTRPLVHLPNPKPVVRLPPSAQPSPALLQRPHETPRHGETRHSHIQHSHDSHVSISAVAGSLRSSGYTGEVHLATWWQEKIDGLLGKKSASASPALSASMGGKNALVVSSSTKEPYDVLTMPGTAAVCLPNGMEGLGLEATFPPILQVASKNVEEEEEIFEDREAGSLPVVRVPAMAPPKAWEPVLPRPEARARSKFVKPVQAVSKEAFSIANLNRDNDNVIVKFVFMGEAKVVNMPRSGSYGASRGRGGGRARRGGKGRGESGASYDRKSHTRHSSSSGAGSASPSAGSSHVSHAQQPPTAPKTVTASAVPPTAPRTANTQPVAKAVSPAPTVSKPAYPPSTQPMTWASRVARGV